MAATIHRQSTLPFLSACRLSQASIVHIGKLKAGYLASKLATHRKLVKALLVALYLTGMHGALYAQSAMTPCPRFGRMIECVAIPLANPQDDLQAKQFALPPADKARMYIVRPYVTEPTTLTRIEIDGSLAGHMAPRTYLMLDVPGGEHVITGHTGNKMELKVHLKPGQLYFIEQELNLTFYSVWENLQVVDTLEGRHAVWTSKRVPIANPMFIPQPDARPEKETENETW